MPVISKRKLNAASPKLYTALKAAVNFIENVPDDAPDRQEEFFRCRQLWREAFASVQQGEQ